MFVGFLVLFLWAIVGWTLAWRRGFFVLPQGQWGIQPTLLHTVFIFSLFFTIQLLILWFGEGYQWVDKVALLVGIIVTLLVTLGAGNGAIWGSKNWIENLRVGALTWLLAFPLVSCVTTLINSLIHLSIEVVPVDQVAVRELKSALAEPVRLVATVAAITVLAPLAEELLFRGYLQSWLRTLTGKSVAIVITSFVFTLFHYSPSQGYSNIELLSALFLLSCILGFLYERQRSLWAPIGLHAVFNIFTVAIIYNS